MREITPTVKDEAFNLISGEFERLLPSEYNRASLVRETALEYRRLVRMSQESTVTLLDGTLIAAFADLAVRYGYPTFGNSVGELPVDTERLYVALFNAVPPYNWKKPIESEFFADGQPQGP